MANAPIPLTVIGGYLGSGKTTLLNHLLRNAGGQRLTVLVNDFGELDVDASLIAATHGDTISLVNGCICCAVGDRLVSTLMQIGRRTDPPDQLVIETSGIADPGRVAQIGMAGRRFALHGVVVLVDPLEVRARWDDRHVGETVRRQLSAADLLVLNKIDLLAPGEIAALRAWLAERAPGTPVVECVSAEMSPDLVLSPDLRRSAPGSEAADRGDPAHTHGLATRTLDVPTAIDRNRLIDALRDLPDGVLRAKGVVTLAGTDGGRYIVNRVGPRVTLTPVPPGLAPAQVNRLVLIGRRETIAAIDPDTLGPASLAGRTPRPPAARPRQRPE